MRGAPCKMNAVVKCKHEIMNNNVRPQRRKSTTIGQHQCRVLNGKKDIFIFQHWEHGQWWKIKKLISPLLIASARRCVQEAKGPNRINACPVTKAWGGLELLCALCLDNGRAFLGRFFALRICQCTRPPLQGGRASWLRLRSGWTSMHANFWGNVCFAWWALRVARRALQDGCCGEVQA